ncbi:unnamed protein product [Cyclocybe aegerita]|uniref:Uncharacterized protein n=1 Tax=Cyclocybe aegerita TaxID=1973307 RepID=A0A8S0WCC0_CYCAE|nr:unnamed protein product [Cyclocybe aegerita]
MAQFRQDEFLKTVGTIANTNNPFAFNEHSNTIYLTKWVWVFRRTTAIVPTRIYNQYLELGLLDEGHTIGSPYYADPSHVLDENKQIFTYQPIFYIPEPIHAYTIIRAHLPGSWMPPSEKYEAKVCTKDLKEFSYQTSVGPAQFHDQLRNRPDYRNLEIGTLSIGQSKKTNITNYGIAVLLSVNVSAYKGDIPRNHVLDILKRYRFDLPAGIEHDYANWEKISTFVGYSLTQTRARVKKLIKDSIKANTNIFSLAQMIVHSTPCRTTIQLCSRVALMRAVHAECNGGEKRMHALNLSEQEQDPRPLKQRGHSMKS